MKSRYRTAAEFIFVIHLAIYLTGCRTIESYRPYDPDLDSDALANAESVTLKDGEVIITDENSNLKIVEDVKSGKALSFQYFDTLWNNSHTNFTVTTTADTVSFDKISEIRINMANTGGTVAMIMGGILLVSFVVLAIVASQMDFSFGNSHGGW